VAPGPAKGFLICFVSVNGGGTPLDVVGQGGAAPGVSGKNDGCNTIQSTQWESKFNLGKKEIIEYTLTCKACFPGKYKCVRNEMDLYGTGFQGGGVGQHTKQWHFG
jgi:hypothetical protein